MLPFLPVGSADSFEFYFACLSVSALTYLVTYFLRRGGRRELIRDGSFVGDLLGDFWFDQFITRKLLSLVYLLWCILCLSSIFFGVIRGGGLFVLFGVVYWILGRICLELVIVLFKIAENTRQIARVLSAQGGGVVASPENAQNSQDA